MRRLKRFALSALGSSFLLLPLGLMLCFPGGREALSVLCLLALDLIVAAAVLLVCLGLANFCLSLADQASK